MADALPPNDQETPGNQPSPAEYGPEQLRKEEDRAVGQPASPNSSSASPSVSNPSAQPKTGAAGSSDNGGAPGQVGYNASGGVPEPERSLFKDTPATAFGGRLGNLVGTRRRKVVLGSGAVGFIGGLVLLFSVASGPLQFVHLSQLEQRFHLSSVQNQQDSRVMKLVRFAKYVPQGEIEKTRLGTFGNHFANNFEASLNASGLESAYSPRFGLLNGYVVDTENEKFKGMSNDQIKQSLQEKYGVKVTDGGTINTELKGRLVIDARGLGFFKTRSLMTNLLDTAGYSKISAAVGSRIMCARASCSFHPLQKLVSNTKQALDNWWNRRNQADANGANTVPTEPASDSESGGQSGSTEGTDIHASISGTEDQIAQAKQDPTKIDVLRGGISAKLTGGAAAALGVLCMVKSINNEAGAIKQVEVVLPLIRMGTEMVALGEQVKSGQDVNLAEFGKYSSLLAGKDSSGQTSDWTQAAAIQANLGRPGKGVPADSSLAAIGKGVPFGFINTIPLIGTACSFTGQLIAGTLSLAIDFTGIGALGGQLASAGVQAVVANKLGSEIANWMAGQAINVLAVGADFGNYVDYGTRLAANDQAIAAGGRALSTQESATLASFENKTAQQSFDKRSIAYKLFSPTDANSALAKLIDKGSSSPTRNIAKMGSSLLNIGHLFSSLGSVFSSHALAATSGSYDYGFAQYGFSTDELDGTIGQTNPYDNANDVATNLLDAHATTPDGQTTYIDKAKACFGVTIAADSSGQQWNVTSTGKAPTYEDIDRHGCNDTSDPNWLKLRFFIMDTEAMNSTACYIGTDSEADQACTDVNFGGSPASVNAANSGTTVSGSAQQLAQVILNDSNIDLSSFSPTVLTDVQDAAAGKPGTAQVMTSSSILQLIAALGQSHKVLVTAIQSGGQGHCGIPPTPKAACPSDPHYNGDAVDFGSLDGHSLTGRDSGSVQIIQLAETILPAGSRFGQKSCGPQLTLQPGFTEMYDRCNHLHVDVPLGTP